MQKESVIVAIFLVALISVTFLSNNINSQVAKDFAQIEIKDNTVIEGENVKISIKPRNAVYQYGYVYDSNDNLIDTVRLSDEVMVTKNLDWLFNTGGLSPGGYYAT